MSEVKGPLTVLNHILPAGLDAGRLTAWRLRGGRSYMEVRSEIAAALDGLNAEILGAWSDFAFITEEDHMEYPQGGELSDMPDITDLDRVDPKKGNTVGHMIDLRVKGDAIGGTKRFFRDARPSVITASVRNIVQRGRNTFEKALISRAFLPTENALGSSGFDVGYASGSGGTLQYIPPSYGGNTFAANHSHYVGLDTSSTNLGDLLDALAETVFEHGHDGPYVAIVSQADVRTYRGLKGFVQPISDRIVIVDRAGETEGNRYFERGAVGGSTPIGGRVIGHYISPFGEIELRASSRIPTGYASLFKSFGENDPRNPIAIRVHPDVGFGFRIMEEPSWDSQYPVKTIYIEFEYGVSMGMDRTVGATGYRVSGGVFVNPTIS